jgi:hypothetical protein
MSSLQCGVRKRQNPRRVKRYWEIITDNFSKAGCSLGWVSAVDCEGRTIFVADAHRGDGKRFVIRADEKLTAFLELESASRGISQFPAPRFTALFNWQEIPRRHRNGNTKV